MCPLAYVLRDRDLSDVTDADRAGTVGPGPGHMYATWAEYGIRCTVLKGKHFETDNARVWQMLSQLVGTGPGLPYVKSTVQDGRKDFLLLSNMAYHGSNSVKVVEEQWRWMIEQTYNGGDRLYDFDKHKNKWFDAKRILEKHAEMPSESRFVKMFLHSIQDERLLHEKAVCMKRDGIYWNDFEATAQHLSVYVGNVDVVSNRDASQPGRGKRNRNIAAAGQQHGNGGGKRNRFNRGNRNNGGGSGKPYDGPIDGTTYYPPNVYKRFSAAQKKAHRAARAKAKQNKANAAASPAPGARDSYGQNAHTQATQQTSNRRNN